MPPPRRRIRNSTLLLGALFVSVSLFGAIRLTVEGRQPEGTIACVSAAFFIASLGYAVAWRLKDAANRNKH